MAMQTLVLAHAAFGHNHFFKNNYLFQQWTDPSGILDYLEFAKRYVAECEERFGQEAVESVLDAAHALQNQSVFRYRRANKLKLSEYEARRRERLANAEATYSDLWRTVPNLAKAKEPTAEEKEAAERRLRHRLPEENLLYFLEKNSPTLQSLAARAVAHRAQRLAIFLSAAPDQADERRLRDLRALSHRQRALRPRADLRGRAAGDPAQPQQRGVPDRLRSSPSRRHEPLCAGLCDDAGHPAHLRRADRGGSRVVPGSGGPRGLARRRSRRSGRAIATNPSCGSS